MATEQELRFYRFRNTCRTKEQNDIKHYRADAKLIQQEQDKVSICLSLNIDLYMIVYVLSSLCSMSEGAWIISQLEEVQAVFKHHIAPTDLKNLAENCQQLKQELRRFSLKNHIYRIMEGADLRFLRLQGNQRRLLFLLCQQTLETGTRLTHQVQIDALAAKLGKGPNSVKTALYDLRRKHFIYRAGKGIGKKDIYEISSSIHSAFLAFHRHIDALKQFEYFLSRIKVLGIDFDSAMNIIEASLS